MKLKKGDQVKILTGKDKGKTGPILFVFSVNEKVIVEGLNLVKKRNRPKQQGKTGETVLVPRAIPASNVALLCKNCKNAVRVGFRMSGGEKVRYCKKCEAPN
ncbi:MAG: 50S ribosomal protein L24 [Candidatus Liptonbacteria bacterium]|nr:50S ribosomal protein L24 [Candidatus Liptonbacteria bacterium]